MDAVEQVISAWAFAHNIDGAARNDLFARLRAKPLPIDEGMVERVAKAICDEIDRQPVAFDEFSPPMNASAVARAAIEVMLGGR